MQGTTGPRDQGTKGPKDQRRSRKLLWPGGEYLKRAGVPSVPKKLSHNGLGVCESVPESVLASVPCRGPPDHGTKGPRDQRTTGPKDQGAKGPRGQRTKGPKDQRTKGPKTKHEAFVAQRGILEACRRAERAQEAEPQWAWRLRKRTGKRACKRAMQ